MTNNEHARPLQPGEIRTHTVGARIFQVMHVAGGSYTQASVRQIGCAATVLCTNRFEQEAVTAYADAIMQAEMDILDADEEFASREFVGDGDSLTLVTAEDEQVWYFTFGGDHTHPVTGESLRRAYVMLHGAEDSTRDAMFAVFGNRWAFQYSTAEQAGVDRYNLREVALQPGRAGAWAHCGPKPDGGWTCSPTDCDRPAECLLPDEPPRTPAEARRGVSDRVAAALNELATLRRDVESDTITASATLNSIARIMDLLKGETR